MPSKCQRIESKAVHLKVPAWKIYLAEIGGQPHERRLRYSRWEKTRKRHRDMERAAKPGPLSKYREESSEAFEPEELDKAERSQVETISEASEPEELDKAPERSQVETNSEAFAPEELEEAPEESQVETTSEAPESEELDEAREQSQLEATLEAPETHDQELEDYLATSAASVSSDQDSE